ncbi:MAG TPA: ankyrin repeat domain-containing protein [Candidatus Angelobacter sp.]|nr:ankyrin repeat domain-containing protein [Candidatus Angelobacter sp.]
MDTREFPAHPNLEQYRKQAKEFLKAYQDADMKAMVRVRRNHPRFRKLNETEFRSLPFVLADAQLVIAREHGFESWPKFVQGMEDLERKDSQFSIFESAADAIVTGDIATLARLLRENPGLVHARSEREHRAPLIHYVAANGVEDFRQKTPQNIVEITRLLLKAGAEVDATTDAYGGPSTALGLAATSYHPAKAGVDIPLLEILLKHGALPDGAPGGWHTVTSALANGRPRAAQFLARHDAKLDLEGAAGVGRLDVVKTFFAEDGSLKANATRAQMESGFAWACEYGHTSVADFLLQHGMKVDDPLRHNGQTGLHWAAYNAHVDTVKLLLERRAPVNIRDKSYNGTPLGWALYAWSDPPPETDSSGYYETVALLVAAGAIVDQEWIADADRGRPLAQKIHNDARMLAALRGEIKLE